MQLWLTCPECGQPSMLLCNVTGPAPEHLKLVQQDCECSHPEDAWPEVWEEAQLCLAEEKEPGL